MSKTDLLEKKRELKKGEAVCSVSDWKVLHGMTLSHVIHLPHAGLGYKKKKKKSKIMDFWAIDPESICQLRVYQHSFRCLWKPRYVGY